MVQITYTLRLDMRDTGIVNTSLRLKQGDSGMKIAVNVFNGGVSAFDSSTTPKIVFRRPDGASVMADMTVESSLYSYTLVGNELQVPGKELIDIKFPIGAEGRESTMSCSIEVVPDTITPNTHGSGIYDNDLAVLVEEATEAAETVEEVVGDSEAWANGERNGVPVGPEDPAYHNNSKYWSEQANPTRFENLTDVDFNNLTNGDIPRYNSETSKWENSDALSVAEGAIAQNTSNISDIDAEISTICNVYGSKNLLKNTATTTTYNDVTWTVNADKSVTLSGTSGNLSDQNSLVVNEWTQSTNHQCIINGASASTNANVHMYIWDRTTNSRPYTDSSKTAVIPNCYSENPEVGVYLEAGHVYDFYIRVVGKNTPTGNVTFYPMITDARIKDRTYVPYAMTNRELTEKKQYNVTTSITSSNATVQVAFIAIRKGTMVNLYGYVQANTSITAGSNITGTFSGMPKPLWPCTSATFSATMTFCANLGIDGAFTVRVPANISNGQSIFLNFTYATEDLI